VQTIGFRESSNLSSAEVARLVHPDQRVAVGLGGIPKVQATTGFGAIVVVTGFVGTFAGGWLGDYCLKYSRQAYLWFSGATTLLAVPFVIIGLTAGAPLIYYAGIVCAQLLLFMSTGPINAAIINLVIASERATAIALSVFAIHVLGDAISPLIVGAISDASSLATAMQILPVAVLVGGFVWVWAARAQGASTPVNSSAL